MFVKTLPVQWWSKSRHR